MKKIMTITTLSLLLAGCSLSSSAVREQWQNYDENAPLASVSTDDTYATLIFYRPSAMAGKAVNVYINGRYQASLLKSGYTAMQVCAEKSLLAAAYSGTQGFGLSANAVSYALPVNQLTFIRVEENQQGEPVFVRVSEAEAQSELPFKGKMSQTLSRVSPAACQGETVMANAIMNTQAVWGVDHFAYADILPAGKQEIAKLVSFVKQHREQVQRIEVSGYTDPQASESYNRQLSQRRAEAVRQGLEQAGIQVPIQAVGYGKENLIIRDCAAKHPQNRTARNACNAPNRRVEIAVFAR